MTKESNVIDSREHQVTMSSLEIAKETGKRHKDVLEAIRKMEPAWERICGRKFPLTSAQVQQPNGGYRSIPMYVLNYKECMYVAAKFNDETRAKLVKRWDELETGNAVPMSAHRQNAEVPRTPAEIILMQAQMLVESEKRMAQIESKQQEIEEKVSEIAIRTKTDCQYSTIIGFAKRYGLELPLQKASTLGRVAINICRQYQLETGLTPDPRFGTVRTYPDSVLFDTFEKYYPNVRFR